MDYEKKYNEALEIARQIHNGNPSSGTAIVVCEQIFPQLRESEDERIINQLITLVDSTGEVLLIPTNKEELIAWLKKQKENPKSADSIPSDCVSDAKCEDKSPKHSDSYGTDIRDTPAYWKGWDDAMKQKEQKHPNGCFTCDEYKKGYEEGRRNGFTAGYNKAMKEVEQKEQKPVKHPKMVEMLREHLENTPKEQLDVEFEELKNWNDVGPTVEEFFHGKPIEWNEKDEKMRACAISLLQISRDSGMAINPGFGKPVRAINKCIDWLKSLRPSWKPSEEQMEALLWCTAHLGGADRRVLAELYEHLKKLM